MQPSTRNNYFVLTGAPGGGKTSILKELQKQGIVTVPEPAREIIAEQRAFGGNGLYDKDPALFNELMLSRALLRYGQHQNHDAPVVFDRGIPDQAGYAEIFGTDTMPARRAAETFRYNQTVFLLPAWEEIYKTDDERKMTFEAARDFGVILENAYKKLGYTLLEVPKVEPSERVRFVLSHLCR